ncbi:winged helix DNA-binding domain-containing protein [Georgenia sp. TF02-10]|uniref:DNA glycosylase AlkZ-like family protein n=1 Tax=Georgenia sp. TF02-10 TaxID=2917725 RepID=UPI001FA7FFFE|nr:crosslink repair DNA glycosylase YcaQ family protein [Georgenia sp. TF02-10]UNX54184.1 winged helix DNA-binding domain-containing protein [Georgenia sp. TF02-10]
MSLTWRQALGWRLRRHLLDPVGSAPAHDVVRRLVAVPAAGRTDLAVGARSTDSQPGEVPAALADGRLVMVYAWRGATHLMAPAGAADALAVRAASRMWERKSWREYYHLEPADWPALRAVVREALADGPLTRAELGAAVTAVPRFAHLGFAFADPSHTLLKAFTWQGDMSFGPSRQGRVTFQRLDTNPHWPGLPDAGDAGPRAVAAYVRAYGPTTPGHLDYWLGQGLGAGRRRVRAWLTGLGDRLVEVDVDGAGALVLAEDAAALAAAEASNAVRLLPAHDQWVLGPGTADVRVVPPARRAVVSHGADLVVAGGVVSGTWQQRDGRIEVSWFAEAGAAPEEALTAEVQRLGTLLGTTEVSVEPDPG